MLEGSHTTPSRPSGRNNVKVKTLRQYGVASKRQQNYEFVIVLSIIGNINRWHPQQWVILLRLKSGELHEKHAVSNWNLGTISEFA
jgi:hypothetical protein